MEFAGLIVCSTSGLYDCRSLLCQMNTYNITCFPTGIICEHYFLQGVEFADLIVLAPQVYLNLEVLYFRWTDEHPLFSKGYNMWTILATLRLNLLIELCSNSGLYDLRSLLCLMNSHNIAYFLTGIICNITLYMRLNILIELFVAPLVYLTLKVFYSRWTVIVSYFLIGFDSHLYCFDIMQEH